MGEFRNEKTIWTLNGLKDAQDDYYRPVSIAENDAIAAAAGQGNLTDAWFAAGRISSGPVATSIVDRIIF